jgi:hypothetical protein
MSEDEIAKEIWPSPCLRYTKQMAKALDPNDAKLMAAATTGDHVSFRMYAEIGGKVNAKDPTDSDRTSAHKATLGGHEMCLRWMMGLQADFGVQDSDGLTPVHSSRDSNGA